MKQKSLMERAMMFFGVILGFVMWIWGLLARLWRTLWKTISGESVTGQDLDSSRTDNSTRQGVSEVSERGQPAPEGAFQDSEPHTREPDVESGEDSVVQGFGGRDLDATEQQHGELGGIAEGSDLDTSFEEGGFSTSRGDGLGLASSYSTSGVPYGADISEEGVVLTDDDATDREDDSIPLDEGIPNLGEPGDIEDTGPETAAEEAVVDQVEDGVPEEYGQDTEIDSVSTDEPWVADSPGDDDVPAVSRGYREYGEGTDDEAGVEESGTGTSGLYDEVEPSGTGGEVDLENDESPAWDTSDMSIVNDPDEPLAGDELDSLDALGIESDEEILGLRDSDSSDIGDEAVDGYETQVDPDTTSGEHLGITGDFDDADATERLPATPGEPSAGIGEGAALRDSFTTGDSDDQALGDAWQSDDNSSGDYGDLGQTGAFGASPDVGDSDDAFAEDVSQGNDTTETPEDDQHLGISGDFADADATEKVPAQPVDSETPRGEDVTRESFVTGDHTDRSGDEDRESTLENQDSNGDAGQSAAWSTPAGVLDEWPNQTPGGVDATSGTSDDDETGTFRGGNAEQGGADTSGKSSGQVDQITSSSDTADRVDASDPGSLGSSYVADMSSGDAGAPGSSYVADTTDGADEIEAGALGSSYVADMSDENAGDGIDSIHTSAPGSSDAARSPYVGDMSGGDPADLAAASAGDPGMVTGGVSSDQGSSGDSAGATESSTSSTHGRQSGAGRASAPAGAVMGDGTPTCPADYPIKGNANSHIYHRPTDPSYPATIAEYCFATEDDAAAAGFRAPRSGSRTKTTTDSGHDDSGASRGSVGEDPSGSTSGSMAGDTVDATDAGSFERADVGLLNAESQTDILSGITSEASTSEFTDNPNNMDAELLDSQSNDTTSLDTTEGLVSDSTANTDAGTIISHETYGASSQEARDVSDFTGGSASTSSAEGASQDSDQGAQQPGSRKSRKQGQQQSDWLPQGAVKGDGNPICPVEFPIKGNANSRIYHRPTDSSYGPTIPEFCFATEADAKKAGFRAPKG